MTTEQDQTPESTTEHNERVLEENRSSERTGGLMKKLKVESDSGLALVDQVANRSLQQGLDNAKLALLPFFYFVLPLIVIFFIILFELFLPLYRKSWTLPLWRKVVYFVYIFLFLFLMITIIGTPGYIHAYPGKFCTLVLGGSWTAAPTCTVLGALFDALK